ncbi:MAG TPA: glutaredoxin family protein [Ktedonobacterales bacterium]|jgi:glutaredoxin
MVITLYGKAGCGLCDDARELLENLAAQHAFDLSEVDIRHDAALFERYRYRIPVVTIDGREVAEGRIDPAELAAAVAGQSASGQSRRRDQ